MGRSLNKSDAVDIDSLFLTEDALPKARNPEGEIITSTEELHSLLKKLGIIIPRKAVLAIVRGEGFREKKISGGSHEKASYMNDTGVASFINFVNGRIEETWNQAKAR